MTKMNNPVGRLHSLLDQLNNYAEKEQTLGVVVADVLFSVPSQDGANAENMSRAMTGFYSLVRQSHTLILKTSNISQNSYLEPIKQLEAALVATSPSDSLKNFLARFAVVYSEQIGIMADVFFQKTTLGEINQEQIEKLLEAISGFEKFLAENQIDAELKKVLWDGITWLREAVEQYSLNGSEGIRIALDRWYGTSWRTQVHIKVKDESVDNVTLALWHKFETIIPVAANLAQIVSLPISILALTLPK